MEKVDLSFIIPAYNEEESLPKLLDSISMHVPASLIYEVIVADNGSADTTIRIAKKYKAVVIVDETATVARLRNLAAKQAKGHVIVCLDADIVLTEEWGRNIEGVYQSLVDNPWQVTGSRCGITVQPGWIERIWYVPLLKKQVNYINSGHLITSLELFNHVGGFDESLESGEDYAFSQSAISVDAEIINNYSLAVVHEGYPKTLLQFIRREIWHGCGDCTSLSRIKSSKVTVVSLLFTSLHIASLLSVLIFSNWGLGLTGLLMISGICVFSAVYKHGSTSIRNLMVVSSLYYFYFVSRFLSCISVWIHRSSQHRKRRIRE